MDKFSEADIIYAFFILKCTFQYDKNFCLGPEGIISLDMIIRNGTVNYMLCGSIFPRMAFV